MLFKTKWSICNLTLNDWINIFLTMKSALIPFSGSALISLKGVIEVGISCILDITFNLTIK